MIPFVASMRRSRRVVREPLPVPVHWPAPPLPRRLPDRQRDGLPRSRRASRALLRCDPLCLYCDDMDLVAAMYCQERHLVGGLSVLCEVQFGAGPVGSLEGMLESSRGLRSTGSYRYLERKWGSPIVRFGKGMRRGQGLRMSISISKSYDQYRDVLAERKRPHFRRSRGSKKRKVSETP